MEQDPYRYKVEGKNVYDIKPESKIDHGCLVIYDDGEELVISSAEEGVRFLFISGKPIGEPIAWYGPIVMNTQEELRTAFEEYNRGTFLKHNE